MSKIMYEKNIKSEDVSCNKTIYDAPVACNCQGLCTCEDFVYDAEVFACEDCCCDEEN